MLEQLEQQNRLTANQWKLIAVGSEEARSIALALASVRRSNWACSFRAPSFHEDAARRAAMEGIIEIRFTSPYSP